MRRRRAPLVTLITVLTVLVVIPSPAYIGAATGASALDVVFSEIAWMGTTASSTDEWIELYNNTGSDIDLTGWTLQAADGTPSISLAGTIPAGGHFLLERTDDDSKPLVAADQIYTGALNHDGEDLPGKRSKFAVTDVGGDDPTVILGSYDWTEAGAYDHDENTLVVQPGLYSPGAYKAPDHDPVVAGLDLSPEHRVHLPLVSKSSTIEVVVTARGENIGYPTEYYLEGYVRNNLTTGPPYSVAVEIDVTIYPYEPSHPISSSEWIGVRPLFTATMPGGINPFRYSLILGKASASIGQVRVAAASPIDESQGSYHSLTVTGWKYEDPVVTGVVRNESGQFLDGVQVAVVNPDRCRWREASLDAAALAPGQETGFRVGYYPSGCVDDSLLIVGQGAARP